ncbi:hypothetical protein NKI98_14785 [Mesorhizobium sp. M0222]|uniref:hypothetical protein n=1 Tax=unclassified Mesorhizobium TaxID=325217 RepID=UPI0004CFA04D|nr:hypothetical protein [Mesorhizobium sp. L2C066B000]
MEKIEHGYQVYKPTAKERFWNALGFGLASVPRPDDDPAFAEGWAVTTIVTHFDWRDRLRIVISGKVQTKVSLKTDVPVARAKTYAETRVMPPWA